MLNVQVATDDGAMGAYLAKPKDVSGTVPAVVILMEVFGVNRFIRRIADYWAEQGLIVLAPDLYWRIRPGIELDPETDGHRDQALKTREGMDIDLAAKDVESCVSHLRGMSECSGKVATSGYCLGGLLAYLSGVRGTADANVSYYGVGIEGYLKEADNLKTPMLLHIGGIDPWTPLPVQRALEAGLGPIAGVETHVYLDTNHAFAREGASADVPAMRMLANDRTKAFFERSLGR
jgi:carboxymethylenebutenolidase